MVKYKKYVDIEIFEGKISKHQYPWHFHNSYTFIFVEKGTIFYQLQHTSIQIGEAEILIIEPFKVHRNIISQTTTYKAFFIPQEYFIQNEKTIVLTQKVKNPTPVFRIKKILNKINQNFSRGELVELFGEIVAAINEHKKPPLNYTSDSLNVMPALNHNLTIEELAKNAHLSKFHFQRKFKKECGLTIGQLKQQEKTIKAKLLLENGKLSTDVAYELGFFDQSHFIKYFKKMWAVTPKHF